MMKHGSDFTALHLWIMEVRRAVLRQSTLRAVRLSTTEDAKCEVADPIEAEEAGGVTCTRGGTSRQTHGRHSQAPLPALMPLPQLGVLIRMKGRPQAPRG